MTRLTFSLLLLLVPGMLWGAPLQFSAVLSTPAPRTALGPSVFIQDMASEHYSVGPGCGGGVVWAVEEHSRLLPGLSSCTPLQDRECG